MGSNVRGILSVVMSGLLLGGPLSGMAQAVDGVKLIDQNKALAGNVTPGDAPGFPVTVSQPGSYALASNLTVPDENTTAIRIIANDVTLDLNGFTIQGPAVCSGAPLACSPTGSGSGIEALLVTHTTVIDGMVRGMGRDGIAMGSNARLERVHAASNGRNGIFVGFGSTVSGNTASANGGAGIHAGATSVEAAGGNTVSGNTAIGNRGDGIAASCDGLFPCLGSTVSGNTASDNGRFGIFADRGSTVTGNSASFNDFFGLLLADETGYTQNVMNDNSLAAVQGGVSLGQNLCDGVVC